MNIFLQLIIFIYSFYFSFLTHLKEIPKYLSSNIIEDILNLLFILPEDITVSFNNSLINVTLYNTSDESFSYEKMNINFENCLTILQKVYDLDPFFDYNNNDSNEIYKRCFFIIIKIETDRKLKNNILLKDNNNTLSLSYSINNYNNENISLSIAKNNTINKKPTNHIEYLIFNGKNGNLLNTSYCDDLNVKILHPIVGQDIVDLNTSKIFYEQYSIDVFRANDSFFNDICMNYTSDKNKDMTLSLRRQYIYQNVSFCNSNCTYIEVNYTNNTAVCACGANGVMNDKLLFEENGDQERSFTYNDIITAINYKIFKCYKQVFNSKRLLVNVGNYFSFFLILSYTLCIIHFYRNRKQNVMAYYQKVKEKIAKENLNNSNANNINNNNDQRSSSDNTSNKKSDNKNRTNSNTHRKKENESIISDNSTEDKKEEINNNSENEVDININEISMKDIIANPPLKKKKLKLKINSKENSGQENKTKKLNNLKHILNINNSATKDTYNYGEIKLDTADDLIDIKDNNENVEQNFNEVITIKKKKKIQPLVSTNSILSSTKNNTVKSNTKKSSYSSNLNNTITSNNKDENISNKKSRHGYNYIFPLNYSVEIPISNIVPSFLKSNKNLLNVNNINIQNLNIRPSYSRNSRNNLNIINISKDLTSSQNTFILKRNLTKTSNAMHNNYITKHDQEIISEKEDDNNINNKNNNLKKNKNKKPLNKVHNSTLRRTKEIELPKKTKTKKKDGNIISKSFFSDFDENKFEIAILIDNRNFCEKLSCELKEKCIVILLVFRKDIIFKQIELSSFILSYTLDYFFNAFFYSDIYLQEEFEKENLIRIFIDYPKEIFSSFASVFIVKLIELLMEEHTISLFLKRVARDNRNYLRAINFLIKKYEKRFYIYIGLGYFFLILTWYFTSAFCTVYQNSQFNLLFDSLQSLALNIFLPLPLCFLSIVFRHFAIKKLNKFLFLISNIIRIFA